MPDIQLLPTMQLPPAIPSSCLPSSSCPSSSSCPLSLCLGFSFSSRLIVLVEAARVEEVSEEVSGVSEEEEEEVGSSEVGSSGKVSLSETVVLVLLTVEAGAVKKGSGFLPSRRRVLGRAIKGVCHQWCVASRRVRVLEAGQRRINLASGPDSINGSVEQSWELVVLIRCYRGQI